ncbi:fibronectin type III domain-containing protein [Polaribacter batillariae]|uniref:Fibronectin type III domain-containing protein n=1 Tax=Polaribacter batillariae TaxID=2808900 RepID=A0ABX7SQT1_9FLAO|nr:fibronectin type III domain-containing protein [Polaribacter batillariae]QTD36592.1 fibronectin type III domain-containing protein [Polaribacter batillariae]
MSTKLSLTLLILMCTIFCYSQEIKPYLQTAKPTSIYINWKTDNNNGTNPEVKYGLTAGNLNMTATGTFENLEPQDPNYNTPYFYHTVKLTRLTPNTGYYYKVKSGVSDESAIEYFKTPPAIGTNTGKLRFIFLGDHQILNYQGNPYYKYNELVQAAKAKAEELYGTPIADNINLIVNDGDQVDLPRLQHYEEIHFEKQNYMTPNIPVITAIGNHELWGGNHMGIAAYYEHFVLDDDLTYQGIDSGTERYYAYQIGNVLFLVLDSELQGATQAAWAQNVINAAEIDPNVSWIITDCHRPYEAEQYANDYSSWYVNQIVPTLKNGSKFVYHVAGHHHLYARGQLKDYPAYHTISGGTAWPQYWGDSNNEVDREETQGSWNNFAYQIMEIDNDTNEMTVQSYSIGSLFNTKNNVLIDEFHLRRGIAAPDQPTITNNLSNPIELPYTFSSSAYSTSSTEDFNSTQFQISSDPNFDVLEVDSFRNKDNFYGADPNFPNGDEPLNVGEGIGIFDYTANTNMLINGTHYLRVRHRDENLGWSPWSPTQTFEIINSTDGDPIVSVDKNAYNTGETINVSFANFPGNNQDWIGIYPKDANPGSQASTSWQYTNGAVSGTMTFSVNTANEYYIVGLLDNGYTEITERVPFWVGNIPTLTTDQIEYDLGNPVTVTFTGAPNNNQDWIGIYKVGTDPETAVSSTAWDYVDATDGSKTFNNLGKGYYFAAYFLTNGYFEIGERVFFQVGDQITSITTNKSTYELNEAINVTFNDSPGLEKDWLGIYDASIDPSINGSDFWTYKYFGGLANGTTTIDGTGGGQGAPNQMPGSTGDYFIVMFTDDSYIEVSNRVYFEVVDSTLSNQEFEDARKNVIAFPNPLEHEMTVKSKYPISRIELYDLAGKKVYQVSNLNKKQFKLFKNNLPSGTYILKVDSDRLYNLKVVVK